MLKGLRQQCSVTLLLQGNYVFPNLGPVVMVVASARLSLSKLESHYFGNKFLLAVPLGKIQTPLSHASIVVFLPQMKRRLQASSGRQIELHWHTRDTLHSLDHLTNAPSLFDWLFKLQNFPSLTLACQCRCCPAQASLPAPAPPPPQHPPAGSV